MGWFGDTIDENRRIEEDLFNYPPEDREMVLNIKYGRIKDDFPWLDFGEEISESCGNCNYSTVDAESEPPDVCDTGMMTRDQIWELGNAGIDPDEFDLMDNDEKIEALIDAGLEPDDFE